MTISILAAQTATVSDWQTAAGGKMAFEVASIKPTKDFRVPNVPLNLGDAKPAGGRFSATFPLMNYVAFAYKVLPADFSTPLPQWTLTDFFDIEASGAGNPTKDQMRLMMQSLLADRFKLKVHFDIREGPVLALTLVTMGQTGPKLRPHADGPVCPDPFEMPLSSPRLPRNPNDLFPPICDVIQMVPTTGGGVLLAGRDTTMETVAAEAFHGYGSWSRELDKPVIDKTGLKGRYDFKLVLPASGTQPDGPAPENITETPFIRAVREQLGLKLVSAKGPNSTLVVDHVEPPSQN